MKHTIFGDGIIRVKVSDALAHPKVKAMLAVVARIRQSRKELK